MVDGCGDVRTAGGIIGPFYQPGFGRISNAGATDSTRGGRDARTEVFDQAIQFENNNRSFGDCRGCCGARGINAAGIAVPLCTRRTIHNNTRR